MDEDLRAERLLGAYAMGIFPMADDDGAIHWFAPDPRAVMDLETFKVSRSLRAVIRRDVFEVTINRAFVDVILACADRSEGTWISQDIREAYTALHRLGFAHSIEIWEKNRLVGGLYGVAIGAAFFGESMFHRVSDASKVAMVGLVERMRDRRYTLLDVQFVTDHLARLGAVEIPRCDYERRLREAVGLPRAFDDTHGPVSIPEPGFQRE